jgi:hypothetical protein
MYVHKYMYVHNMCMYVCVHVCVYVTPWSRARVYELIVAKLDKKLSAIFCVPRFQRHIHIILRLNPVFDRLNPVHIHAQY